MSWTPTDHTWDPKQAPPRFADTTANIHRTIAWLYGVVGVVVVALFLFVGNAHDSHGIVLVIGLVIGAIVALHAALAVGARNRNGVAKFGSVIVGVLMLAGFPIGTIVGGYLIYNGVQNWPPKRAPGASPAGPDMRGL